MKTPFVHVMCLAVLSLQASSQGDREPGTEQAGTDGEAAPVVFALPAQELMFKPTREDITIGKVILNVYIAEPGAVKVNGETPRSSWREVRLSRSGVEVERAASTDREEAWFQITLPEVRENVFRLRPLTIASEGGKEGPLVCVSLKFWFNEVPNMYDSMLYKNLDDRYALVTFSTTDGDLPQTVRPRFGMNRARSNKEFAKALKSPIAIDLKDFEIPDEWRTENQ